MIKRKDEDPSITKIDGLPVRYEKDRELPEVVDEEQLDYFFIPGAPATNMAKKILNNPGRVSSTRRGEVKQSVHLTTKDSVITYAGKDSSLTFTLEKTKELFTKKIKSGAKVFNFILQKLNEQHRPEIITFQLIELVNNGIYANKDSAYKGLKSVFEKMYSISLEGTTTEYEGNKKKEKSFAKSRIISAFKVTYTDCIVSITPVIRDNVPYITLLPRWSYTLKENSFMLLDYILYLSRQNAKKLKEDKHFNISMEAIRVHMGLPTVAEAGEHPQQLIITPIDNAITGIEETGKGADVKITPCYNYEYKNVSEYLTGYLKIEPDDKVMQYMECRAKAQEDAYKNTAKIIDKAKITAENRKQKKKV